MTTLTQLAEQASRLQAHGDELRHRFQGLTAFEEAARFDADTLAAIRLFERYRTELGAFASSEEAFLQQAVSTRNSLPLLKRLFAARAAEKEHNSSSAKAREGIASVDNAVRDLYDLIDRTPASKAEQRQMLAELRLLKKEITTEKRSVSQAMRDVRTKARQDMTSWTGVRGGFVGSVARLERMQIRHGKEADLSPHEGTRAGLERQIVEVERRINWVSRFQGADPQAEEPALRCAYCGRRVPQSAVCPGCGSDKTTRDL